MTASIGPYQIVRLLGEGGMGAVYEVRHPELLGRRLALKVVKKRDDDQALARFGREAELLARIRHPGVLTIHTLGRTPTGDPYLVTDLVPGEELRRFRREGRLPWETCAELTRDLAGALEAVHAAGIVHRDLKPENVIVTPEGDPVVLDFGVARGTDVETLTQTGALVGTVHYMSPEQAEGTIELDARTDVYALGGILYFLLTGQPPYEGGKLEVIATLLRSGPAPDPAELDPEVPPGLAAICRRALTRDRAQRTPDAATLRAELETRLREGDAPLAPARRRTEVGLALLGLAIPLVAIPLAGRATQSPTPTPTPTPEVASASTTQTPRGLAPSSAPEDDPEASGELEAIREAWARVQKGQPLAEEADVLNGRLATWLEANASHSRAERARQLQAQTLRRLPLRVLPDDVSKGSAWASLRFLRTRHGVELLSVAWQGGVLRWTLPSWRQLHRHSLEAEGERGLHAAASASLLLPRENPEDEPRLLIGGMFGFPLRGPPKSIEECALFEVGLDSGDRLRAIRFPRTNLRAISLARSPSGRIAIGTSGSPAKPSHVHVLDAEGAYLRELAGGNDVHALEFAREDLLVAVLGDAQVGQRPEDRAAHLVRWEGPAWTETRLSLPFDPVSLAREGGRLYVGGAGGELITLPMEGEWRAPRPALRGGGRVAAAPLQGLLVVSGGVLAGYGAVDYETPQEAREIVFWRRSEEAFTQVRRIPRPRPVRCFALSPDGRFVASRGIGDRVEIWDRAIYAPE